MIRGLRFVLLCFITMEDQTQNWSLSTVVMATATLPSTAGVTVKTSGHCAKTVLL